MNTSTTTSSLEDEDSTMTAKEYLELGLSALDSSSVWTTTVSGSGDAGLSHFQAAMKLAGCTADSKKEGNLLSWLSTSSSLSKEELVFCAELWFHQGRCHQRLKDFEASLASLEFARSILESTVGRYQHNTTAVYFHMGKLYETMGDIWLAQSAYHVAARVEQRLYGSLQGRPWDVVNSVEGILQDKFLESLELELMGDIHAKNSNKEQAVEYYQKAILKEQVEFGSKRNANLVLLNRKLVLPLEDSFGCSLTAKNCGCPEIQTGDALYLTGNYTGAIAAYERARTTCGNQMKAASGTSLVFWLLLVVTLLSLGALGWKMQGKKNQKTAKRAFRQAKRKIAVLLRRRRQGKIAPPAQDPKEEAEPQDTTKEDDKNEEDQPILAPQVQVGEDDDIRCNTDLVLEGVKPEDLNISDLLVSGIVSSAEPSPREVVPPQGDLVESCCESLGAIMAARTHSSSSSQDEQDHSDWSFQPKSDDEEEEDEQPQEEEIMMPESLQKALFGKK